MIVPVQTEYFALEGLAQVLETIALVRRELNPRLTVAGMVLTMHDARTRLGRDVERDVREHFPGLVFETVIPRNIRLSEAPSYGVPVTLHDPYCAGADAYVALAREVATRDRLNTARAASPVAGAVRGGGRYDARRAAPKPWPLGGGAGAGPPARNGARPRCDHGRVDRSGQRRRGVPPDRHRPRSSQTRGSRGGVSMRMRSRVSPASMQARGLLQPVLVRPADEGRFELIAGERRWRAAQLAGLETIPALVRVRDDAESLELALIENMAREDLNPVEEARACAALVEELGLSREEVGVRVGRSRVAVSNLIRLLDLPDEALELLERGALSEGHGRALLMAADHGERRRSRARAADEGWSVRELEARARESNRAGQDAPTAPASPRETAPRSARGLCDDRRGPVDGARRGRARHGCPRRFLPRRDAVRESGRRARAGRAAAGPGRLSLVVITPHGRSAGRASAAALRCGTAGAGETACRACGRLAQSVRALL